MQGREFDELKPRTTVYVMVYTRDGGVKIKEGRVTRVARGDYKYYSDGRAVIIDHVGYKPERVWLRRDEARTAAIRKLLDNIDRL